MEAHREYMSDVLDQISGTKNTIIIQAKKHAAIKQILKAQADKKSFPCKAKLKWWIKNRGITLINFPDLGLEDVLVMLKKGRYKC